MPTFAQRSEMPASADAVYQWHARPGVLGRLLPPWESIEIVEEHGTIHDGDYKKIRLRKKGLSFNWIARHRDHIPGQQFVDEAEGGPFRSWAHTHRFLPLGAQRSELHDSIEYELPFGGLGRMLLGRTVANDLQRTFQWRHQRTRFDLERQATTRRDNQRVLIGGASGLVGSALQAFLDTGGHEVWTLVRRTPTEGAREIQWDPYRDQLDPSQLEGFDAVINLSGANIAGQRWTDKYKQTIRSSRVKTTSLLAETIAKLQKPPAVFISASAVGIYGNRDDEPLDETSPPGDNFLAETCLDWERCVEPAEQAGVRTVRMRIGVVLALRGGALAKMLLPFQLGLGGALGNGRQFLSWIALEDLIGLFDYAIFNAQLRGPVNATAPHPVRQGEFAKTLGRVLHRPTIFPAPSFLIRTALGQMGQQLLLDGARVLPVAASQAGFEYLFPYVEDAIRWEIGRSISIGNGEQG